MRSSCGYHLLPTKEVESWNTDSPLSLPLSPHRSVCFFPLLVLHEEQQQQQKMPLTGRKKASEQDTIRRSQIAESITTCQEQSSRQQEQIRHMVQENEDLKKEISTISGTHYDYVKADKLATLQSDVDGLERRYQFEKMRKNDLTRRYQLIRIDLMHSRKLKGGVNVEKEQAAAVQRQVDILESRLDQALGRFNDALSYNKELRDQIDIIREERRVFQRVHKRMEDELRSKKRVMADHIEKSNKDMDERDVYLHEAEELQQAIVEQRNVYNEQLREMDKAMMEIKTMREEQTGMQLELEAREYEFEERMSKTSQSQPSEEATQNMTRRGGGGAGDEPGAPTDGDALDEAVNVLKVDKEPHSITSILTQIKEATKDEDLDHIRTQYLHVGDLNFSMYKFINEISAKKESAKDNIRDLRRLLSEEEDSEQKQRKLIKQLEEQLAETEVKLMDINNVTESMREALRRTAAAVEDVYVHIGCPQMDKAELNSGSGSCTEANVKLFLGTVEERATQILAAFQRHHQGPQRRRQIPSNGAGYQEVKEPSQGEEEEDNALTANTTDSPRVDTQNHGEDSGAEDEENDLGPIVPMAPQTGHNAVDARNLVRLMELPSASLGAGTSERDAALFLDKDDDVIVSHDEIRKQMELRLIAMRERDDRGPRKKKDNTQKASPNPFPKGGPTSMTK